MKNPGNSANRNACRDQGFALIATITLMVLLAILALGMLSLSTVSLRTSGHTDAITEARSNARMALMIALGELQKQMGPDQRISANASILSLDQNGASRTLNQAHWTGVWDSWIAGPLSQAKTNPRYNTAESHHQTIGNQPDNSMRPAYTDEKDQNFRSWLVSLDPARASNWRTPLDLAVDGQPLPSGQQNAVRLVGLGSLGADANAADFVSVPLLRVEVNNTGKSSRGRYAWWVGDESQKARLSHDSYEGKTLTTAERIFRTQTPASVGTKVIPGFENLDDDRRLSGLPTMMSLGLVADVANGTAEKNFHHATPYSYHLLADVREGGLKRDLSAILEREIKPDEVYNLTTPSGLEAAFKRAISVRAATATEPGGDDFMLYRFDNMVTSISATGEASVPIQDLAAYYQLYDHDRVGWKGGIQFSSQKSSPPNNQLPNGIMVSNPDYGVTASDYEKYLRHHSALYRSVYPVKIEYILSYITEPRPQAEIDLERNGNPSANPPVPPNPNPDTHRLKVGITPAMTWWNPNNVPVVMNFGNPDLASIMIRENAVPLQIDLRKHNSSGGPVTTNRVVQMSQLTNTQQGELYTLFVSGASPVVFQPGESKVLALRFSSQTSPDLGLASLDFYLRGTGYRFNEPFVPSLELIPGWNPERFIRPTGRQGVAMTGYLNFKESDYVSAVINTGSNRNFSVDFTQKSRHGRVAPGVMWHYRSYGLRMRMFPGGFPNFTVYTPFLTAFNAAGLNPTGGAIANTAIGSGIPIPARSGQILIHSIQNAADLTDDIPQAFFYYGMKAATETHESSQAFPASGAGAARRFPARPFTHSTVMIPQFIDSINGPSLYNTGWNWNYMPLNNILDAPISISRASQGYYGGGYTAENGTTHVVQQELPIAPIISIAALSHAQLSGYSLSCEAAAAGYAGLQNLPATEAFRRTTAIGFGGLEPRTLQAIGNSYAHPNIPKDKAITAFNRIYFQNTGTEANHRVAEPFADHSYLANKALWDDFFFSSITPVPANNPVFNSPLKTVGDVANGFFFGGEKLPNRRMVPYTKDLNSFALNGLVGQYSQYKNGFADRIASYMMVEGGFNINSTSVDAWRALFSSLKGRSVTYLDPEDAVSNQLRIKQDTVEGVPVGAGSMTNAVAYAGSTSDPSDPKPWRGWRELTDDEINQLAEAIVKQVRMRGPFLSLSEFVNRRIDPNNTNFSLRGALQAAIDDDNCTINAGFRASSRRFSNRERTYMNAVFPEAMDGPVAYGSSAYVDQADLLRNIASQLTPRGDTFVIRTYGDSLDSSGNVRARAWCEAVVQRVPDYIDHKTPVTTSASGDTPETKQNDLNSEVNKVYGRKFEVVSFRWLSRDEV